MAVASHYAGQTILITGATNGIGLELARQLHAAGAILILLGRRDPSELDPTFFTAQRYCQADLSKPEEWQQLIDWLDAHAIHSLDYVFHNAGLGDVGPLSAQSVASIETMITVNLTAPIALTHLLYARVCAAKGRFVYISSVAATRPVADNAVYAATKAGLEGFARSFQAELSALRSPVKAVIVRVGATQTAMHPKSGAAQAHMNWENSTPTTENAQSILTAARDPRQPQRPQWTTGQSSRLLHTIGRLFPSLAEWAARRPYNKAQTEDPSTILSARMKNRDTGKAPARPHCAITGAAAGIGRALAHHFGHAGYTLTGIDHDREAAMRTQAELNNQKIPARFIVADLANPQQCNAATARLADRPPIDIFIHSAGISAVGYFHATPLQQQLDVLRVNLVAPVIITRALLADRRLKPDGTLVFISSLSHFTGYPGAAVYAAAKDAISALASSLAVALAPAGLHVLTVYPGPTRTEHARRYSPDNSRESRRMPPESVAAAVFNAVVRRRRILIPGLVNRAVAFLGCWHPAVTEYIMRRTILDQLPKPNTKDHDTKSHEDNL